jgi:fucose 4-O-acetylase-like acetyltransferase
VRLLYVDNLKAILITAIIAGHAVAGYGALALWSYGDVREVTLSPLMETALLALVAPFGLCMIPLLFLIAGLFTPASVRRKGPGGYARDRLLRLGVPFAVFTLLLWPVLLYALYRPLGNAPGSYWAEFVGTAEESLDTGYFWFVGDLLIFSLVYAAWVAVRRVRTDRAGDGEIHASHLLAIAAAVTVATFLVRLAFPFASENYVDLNLYQWPECVALFALGILAARHGWLTAVPDRLRNRCRTAALTAVGALAVFTVAGVALGGIGGDTWRGGWHWEALVFAASESALAVFGPVWLLGAAQRHLNQRLRWVAPWVSRSAYGAFMMQGPVLIGFAVALRPIPLPAEIKALVVAVGSVAGSFALAWLLISRIPGVNRIL